MARILSIPWTVHRSIGLMIADDPRADGLLEADTTASRWPQSRNPSRFRSQAATRSFVACFKSTSAGLGLEKYEKKHINQAPTTSHSNQSFVAISYFDIHWVLWFSILLGMLSPSSFGTFLVGSSHWPRANVCCQKAIKQNKPGGGKTAACFCQKIWDMSDPGSYDFLQVIHCTTFVALRSMSSWNHPVSWVVLPDGYAGQSNSKKRNECIVLCSKCCTGWWFGTWILFSPIVGMMIQSDFHIFQGGWNHQLVYIMCYRYIMVYPKMTILMWTSLEKANRRTWSLPKILLRWLVSVRPNVKLFINIYIYINNI